MTDPSHEDVNQEIIDFLTAVSTDIWEYFHKSQKPYDPNLCCALGQISAKCDMAIQEYKRRTD